MIFVFVEDGTLEIVSDINEARAKYEGVDVENMVFEFYNENGVFLEPIFTKPNKYSNILWFFKWSESGEYDLEPSSNSLKDPFWLQLYETSHLEKNPWFYSLDELKDKMRMKGVEVDPPSDAGLSCEI